MTWTARCLHPEVPGRVFELVDGASAAALATDQENRVVAVNCAAGELLGATPEAIVGSPLSASLAALDVFGNRLCEDACALHSMVRHSEAVQSFDLDVVREGERTVRVAVSVVVVLSPRPDQYHLVYFLRPRLRRRKADEAIDRLLARGGMLTDEPFGATGNGDEPTDLTDRQTEVLRHIIDGLGTQDIADELHISVNTVRNHTQSILRKLAVHSKTEAVSVALRQQLI